MSKFGTKSASFWNFWARSMKNYCYVLNQHSQICLFAKFREKLKMYKSWNKSAVLGIFGLEI